MKRQLKLESQCHIDFFLEMNDVKDALEKNMTLTANVIYIDELNQKIIVKLGGEILGVLPWNEVTMYPLTNKYRLSPSSKQYELRPDQISAIDGKKIRVKVKDITKKGIILSRKDNMLEAWEQIKQIPDYTIVKGSVIGFHKSEAGIFIDIGEGVTTFCHFREYTATRGVLSEWVKYGDVIDVMVYGVSDAKKRINCSRKLTCSIDEDYSSFKKYDILDVKVASLAFNKEGFCGYHVEVNPIVTGIADAPYIARPIQLGETVQAVIRNIKVNERKMSLSIL